jgi:hypothetical protein
MKIQGSAVEMRTYTVNYEFEAPSIEEAKKMIENDEAPILDSEFVGVEIKDIQVEEDKE